MYKIFALVTLPLMFASGMAFGDYSELIHNEENTHPYILEQMNTK